MSSGVARRRAAKAVRRKKALAERRRQTLPQKSSSLAAQVRRCAGTPLHSCLVSEGLFQCGLGMIVLTRKTGLGRLALALFQVDVYCVGVKDAVFREADMAEIGNMVAVLENSATLLPTDPSYARKLLRDLTAWARTLGFEPHSDYGAVELLFGDSPAEACETSFEFGQDGKPLYVPGPFDALAQIRRRLETLRRRVGEDGFELGEPPDEDDEFEMEDAAGYDPNRAPDPAEWLALDEVERLSRIEDYVQNAESDAPNPSLHAAMHAVVENQIALGEPLTERGTIERLMAEGLDRHDAVHAVGCVLAEHMYVIMQDDPRPGVPGCYATALEELTVKRWRAYWDAKDEVDDTI